MAVPYQHSWLASSRHRVHGALAFSMAVSSNYTLRLTNALLREAFARVLNDNGLALKEGKHPSIYRVVRARSVPRSAQARQYFSAAAVLASFDAFGEEFRALHAACDRPQSRLDVDLPGGAGSGRVVANFSSYRLVAQALVLHASAHLALSNAPVALQDATALFRLAESLRDQPGVTAINLQDRLRENYFQVVWEGLAGRRWNSGQVEILEGQLQSIDVLAACRLALEAEQAIGNQWLEQTPRAQLADQFVERVTAWRARRRVKPLWVVPLAWNLRWCPRGWIRQAQIGYMESCLDHLEVLDVWHQRAFPEGDRPWASVRRPPTARAGPVADWCHRNGPHYVQVEQSGSRLQTCVNLARTACALERYRLAQGHFPESLDELRPHFLKRLPRDVMNGGPFHYGPTDDGQFVLYSVGWDGEDQRGSATDWVWRYPAR